MYEDKTIKYYAITFAVGDPQGDYDEFEPPICILGFDEPTPQEAFDFCQRFSKDLYLDNAPKFDFVSEVHELEDVEAHTNYNIATEQFLPIFAKDNTEFINMRMLDRKPDSVCWETFNWPPF